MNKLDKYYIGGGRKRIIDTYFNGVEHSSKEFNDSVYKIWQKEEDYRKSVKMFWIMVTLSVSFGILGFIL